MLGGADRQPVVRLPRRGVQPGHPGSVGQPAAAGLRRQADPGLDPGDDVPARGEDRRDQVITREIPSSRPPGRRTGPGRRRARRASSVCSPARVLPAIAPSTARPARAVSATTLSCGNGADPCPSWAAVPVQPNIARFAGVSATVRPASRRRRTPSSRPAAPPAGHHRRSAARPPARTGPPSGCRHQGPPARDDLPRGDMPVQGERHVREQPGQPRQRLTYDPSGISVIASISRMTSGYDMIRRRCRCLSRPCSSAAAVISSITPSPRCRSSSPSRTKSGSHPPASTEPSLRTTAGAVTTGRQNTASSPADGAESPAVTVPPP